MRCRCLMMFALAALAAQTTSLNAGRDSACKIKASALVSNTVSEGKRSIVVSLEVEQGAFTLANPTNVDFLEESATRVKVRANGKVVPADVKYPAGRIVKEGDYSVSIYEGRVVIQVHIAAEIDVHSITVDLFVHAHNRKICLLPATIKLTPGVMP